MSKCQEGKDGKGENNGDEKSNNNDSRHHLHDTTTSVALPPHRSYRSPVPPTFLGFKTPCPTILICSGSPKTLYIPPNTTVTIPHYFYEYDYLREFYYCAQIHYGLECPHGDRCCWDHSTRSRLETDFGDIQQLLRGVSNNVSISYGYDPSGMAVLTIYDNLCDGGHNNWVDNGEEVVSENDLNKENTRYAPLIEGSNNRLMALAKDRIDYMTRYHVNPPPIKKPSLPSFFPADDYVYLFHQIMMQCALQNMTMALLGHDKWEEELGEESEVNMDYDDDDDGGNDGITEDLVGKTLSYLKGQGVGVSHYREVIKGFDGMFNKIQGRFRQNHIHCNELCF